MPNCQPPLHNAQSVDLRIENLAPGGDGVASVDGFRVFVPAAAPGDKVQARVSELRATFARAIIGKILEPGPGRVTPDCPVAGQCGGCAWQHLSLETQRAAKQDFVLQTLRRVGGIADPPVRPIRGGERGLGYRNKAQVPVGSRGDGTLAFGYYRADSHKIVDLPTEGCRLVDPVVDRGLLFAREHLAELDLRPWDEKLRLGSLRHVMARSTSKGDLMLVLVTTQPLAGEALRAAKAWMGRLPGLKSLLNNIQPKDGNAVLGDETRLIAGDENLTETLDGLSFRLSAQSFFQVNTGQTLSLWRALLESRVWSGKESVLELYCGVGTLSLALARVCGDLLGVENVSAAVEDARANAKLNGTTNVSFQLANAEAGFVQRPQPDVLVLDPPRKGLSDETRAAIIKAKPREIVYVSCDPASLARDCKALLAAGYKLESVQPIDLFPQTAHVESVCHLIWQA